MLRAVDPVAASSLGAILVASSAKFAGSVRVGGTASLELHDPLLATQSGSVSPLVSAVIRASSNAGRRLGGGCPSCGRSLQPGWNYRPYCARTTEVKKLSKTIKERERRELPPANVAEFKKQG